MEELLRLWDCEELIPTFTENGISINNLLKLKEDHIKELIPSVGLRIQFEENLETYKNHQILNDITNLPVVLIANENTVDASSESSEYETIPAYNRGIAFSSMQEFLNEPDKIPEFDLNTLLTVSPYGSLVTNYYKTKGTLNNYMRQKLVDVIIRHLYSYIMKYNFTHEQYNVVTAKIIQSFPKECHSIYYSCRKFKGKALQAKGKLVDKIKNLRYQSPEKNLYKKT